jgi:hypothetical protein
MVERRKAQTQAQNQANEVGVALCLVANPSVELMGLFSRRIIKRLLDENRAFLPDDKTNQHINHLNGASATQRLTTEWEVAVLNALHKIGVQPRYEPTFPSGTSVADVLIKHENLEAVVDITTVSDRGLDEQNPIDLLAEKLISRVRERGLDPNKFGLRVEGNWQELHLGGPKPRLLIPQPDDFDSLIFDGDFSKFLDRVTSSGQKDSFRPRNSSTALLSVTYDPTQPFFSRSHLDYTVVFTENKNPLYNRLNAKASQIKKTGFQGLTGVILCDADCGLLRHPQRQGLSLGANQVISRFLQNEPRVGFVMTLRVKSDRSGLLGPEHLKIVSQMYARKPNSLIDCLQHDLAEALPRPETIPTNAYSTSDAGRNFAGGMTMTSRRIKMSARSVLEVLAGRIKPEDFDSANPDAVQYFARMLEQGRLLVGAKVERVSESDDDWIEFEFSEPDPAISRFARV